MLLTPTLWREREKLNNAYGVEEKNPII